MHDQGTCPQYFVASDVPLPTIDWKKHRQPFWARELTAYEHGVIRHLSKNHVYFVGSHTGCCCGFVYGATPEDDSWTYNRKHEKSAWKQAVLRNAAARRKESLRRLADYLFEALKCTNEVELFYCWEGQEGEEPTRRRTTLLEELIAIDFALGEKELVTIQKSRE